MGGLKPIGSEKLQGIDKLNRIMEIARYNEHQPTRINENKSSEYNILLADGRNYQIVKEKKGYVLQRSINESYSDYDYLEPMRHRRYFSSYSQAFKRLNLVAKEVNLNEGVTHNVSLFKENDDETKYYLKFGDEKKGETTEQQQPVAAPAPAPVPEPVPALPPAAEDVPLPDDMEGEELPDDMEGMEDDDEDEDEVTYKTIQKVTGKLAQKIRAFNSDEENDMSSKDIKYVINSILSALELENLEEEDKESIVDKLEGVEEEEGGDEGMDDMEGMEDMEGMDDMEGDEVEPVAPPSPEGEMAEGIEFDDEDDDYPSKHRRNRQFYHDDFSDDDSSSIDDMFEQIFSESKIDAVLGKYFDKRTIKETKRVERKKSLISEQRLITENIKKLSNNKPQEFSSLKLMEKYPNAKFLGKTISNTLVFEAENKKISVSIKGGYKLI